MWSGRVRLHELQMPVNTKKQTNKKQNKNTTPSQTGFVGMARTGVKKRQANHVEQTIRVIVQLLDYYFVSILKVKSSPTGKKHHEQYWRNSNKKSKEQVREYMVALNELKYPVLNGLHSNSRIKLSGASHLRPLTESNL